MAKKDSKPKSFAENKPPHEKPKSVRSGNLSVKTRARRKTVPPMPSELKRKFRGKNKNINLLADGLKQYQQAIASLPLLTADEEKILARRYQEYRCQESFDILVLANLRLVYSVAKRYRYTNMEFLEILQEGNIGLIKAVGKFDPERGYKMSTYTTWWIRQNISRALAEKTRMIKIPVHINEGIVRINRVVREFETRMSRKPTVEEIAQFAEMTPAEVERHLKAEKDVSSLNSRIGEDGESEYGDLFEDTTIAEPGTDAMVSEVFVMLNDFISTLPEREQHILRWRYNMEGYENKTLSDIGLELGITRERVRQLEQKALAQGEEYFKSRGIKASGDLL